MLLCGLMSWALAHRLQNRGASKSMPDRPRVCYGTEQSAAQTLYMCIVGLFTAALSSPA